VPIHDQSDDQSIEILAGDEPCLLLDQHIPLRHCPLMAVCCVHASRCQGSLHLAESLRHRFRTLYRRTRQVRVHGELPILQ